MVCGCITVVLATLLFPLILAAQSSSNESKCKNNLRQIGLAMHNYHDSYGQFPPGWITKDRRAAGLSGSGWQTALLPYMDHAPLYNQINFSVGFNPAGDAKYLAPFKTEVKGYRCPADVTPKNNPVRGGWPTSNYSGNGGSHPFPRWTSVPGKFVWPGIVPYARIPNWGENNTGIMNANWGARISHITDGTSNTIMVGERSAKSGAGIWPGVTAGYQENDAMTDGSHASRIQQSLSGYSSMHRTANFLICDGAVRPIKSDVDSKPNSGPGQLPQGTFQKLVSKADGQVIGE